MPRLAVGNEGERRKGGLALFDDMTLSYTIISSGKPLVWLCDLNTLERLGSYRGIIHTSIWGTSGALMSNLCCLTSLSHYY